MDFSLRRSLPQTRRVRGYVVRRMPLGAFLSALETLEGLPGELLARLFPGQTAAQALASLRALDPDGLTRLIARLIASAPGLMLGAAAELTGVSEDELRTDPDLGAEGLAELIEAWVEVNGIENFIRTTGGLWRRARALVGGRTGSSGSSPRR